MSSNESPDLGEQAISKAAEIGISSQLDEVDSLDVDIRTDPLKLTQGKLETVAIQGKGLVVKKELRTEELELKTDKIEINPLKAIFGEIELLRPTNAEALVTLTEQDIDRAFNSEYIQKKLQNLSVNLRGKPETVNLQNVRFHLPGDGKVNLSAEVFLLESGKTQQIAFSATPRIDRNGYSVCLEQVEENKSEQITPPPETAPELVNALLESATSLLDLRNIELESMYLRLHKLEAQAGKLILKAEAVIEKFPNSTSE